MPRLAEPSYGTAAPAPPVVESNATARNRGYVEQSASLTRRPSRRGVTQPEDRLTTQERQPFLGEHDMVTVTNIDDVVWRFEWERRAYDLAPGVTSPVPFPAVVNALGDPRSVDGNVVQFLTETGARGVIATRYDTLAMLMARYGILTEDLDALVDWAPKLRVTTMAGAEIVFPAQNPMGPSMPIPTVPERGKENMVDVRQAIAQVESERDAMRAELAEMRRLLDERLAPVGAPDPRQPGLPDGVPEHTGAVPDTGPRTGI